MFRRRTSSLFLITLLSFVNAELVSLPTIRNDAVGQLGFAGDYAGISQYKDTRQFESINTNSSSPVVVGSIVMQKDGTFELVASADGDITATCVDANNNVYLGGSFNQLNNTPFNYITRFDPVSSTLFSLGQGLDGPVEALLCDNDVVYVGGDFVAPIGVANTTFASYTGHAAIWFQSNNSWGPVPWSGFNGPVYTITRNPATNTILFGGRFDSTGDGVYYNPNSSQAMNMGAPTAVSAGNSALSGKNSDPGSIVCQNNGSENEPWLLQDGVPGYWDAEFGYNIQPSLFRISNAHIDGRGTNTFSIIALGSNEYFTLSYIDPTTQQTVTCTTDCVLSNDTSIAYQDFTVVDPIPAHGIRIQIDTWYGLGGGLSNVQIFQSDIGIHPQSTTTNTACASTPGPITTTTGTWQEQFVYGIYQDFLTSTFPASELATSDASVTYHPYIPVPGVYNVYATTPGCVGSSSCDQRTQVDLILQMSPGITSTVTVSQTSSEDTITLIYTGFIAATTSAFRPTIVLKPSTAANATSDIVTIVADSFQFIRNGTNATLTSILEYSPQNFTQNIKPAWHPLAEQLMVGSTVRSIDASSGVALYIGGQFSSVDGTYRNVVSFDYNIGRMVPLASSTINGTVYHVALVDSALYVGGAFNDSAAGSMNNIVEYDLATASWAPLGMGADGPVTKIFPTDDNTTITISGNFTHIRTQNSSSLRVGNAVWSKSDKQWTDRTSLVVGTVTANISTSTSIQILAGRLLGAQTYRADGASSFNRNNVLAYHFGNDMNIKINSGVFWHNTTNGQNTTVVIIGGRFNTTSVNIKSLGLYQEDVWTNLGNLDGEVKSLVLIGNILYIGGQFTGTIGQTARSVSFAIYDLSSGMSRDVGNVYGPGGIPGTINTVRAQPDGTAIYIGGNFSSVGSLSCPSVCKLNTQTNQWNAVALGISGEVYDLAVNNDQIIAVGDISVGSTRTAVARMDTQGNTWTAMSMGSTGIPTAVLSGLNQEAVVAGRNETSSFLATWDGSQFSSLTTDLGASSYIRQLAFMPIASSPSHSRYPADSDFMLLAAGHLSLQKYGNVSAALYDGSQWFPFALSTKLDGTPGQLSQIFYESGCCIAVDIIHHLPVPAVILISIAVSLGIIFVVVGSGLIVLFAKRRMNEPDIPEDMPPYVPGQNRPSSFAAMLDTAQAKTLGEAALAAIAGAAAGERASNTAGPSKKPVETQSGNVGKNTTFAALLATAAANSQSDAPPSDEAPRLYLARYPFEAKEYGELAFDANDPIVVTDASDNVWWMGYKDDGSGKPVSGLFPSNYVMESHSAS
ncbi:cortical protein marker for cell polarity-domain-containing protein [Dichotomocladium elegans]|nr:cortical protein marker for cell polarity-domain-containing protein [Dichotomocladium elegans]